MIIDLLGKESCSGCSACVNVCPQKALMMENDERGFLYPVLDSALCVKCKACVKICPIYNHEGAADKNPQVYACINKDKKTLMRSTSGGAFALFADYVLERGGSVYGAALTENMAVKHIRISHKNELVRLHGSKYVQSDITEIYKSIKNDIMINIPVLFCGTPCQADAIRRYFPKTQSGQLLIIDLVCHGVPSPRIWAEYISYLEEKANKRIINYYFRSKIGGWRLHLGKAVFADGTSIYNTPETYLFSHLFYNNLSLRSSCLQCRYTNYDRPSDITIGDFWNIEKYHPSFDNNRGTSLVMLNTPAGSEVFDAVKDKARICSSTVKKCEQSALMRSYKSDGYDEFWKQYLSNGFAWIVKKYLPLCGKRQKKNRLLIVLHKTGLLSPLIKIRKR